VNVTRTKLFVYVIGGALAGLAAVMNMAKSSQGDPTTATGWELDIIAAVVIGGASLSGGVGTVLGTIIGALLMTTIRTGCVLNGIPTPWTEIITGAIIVVAVIIDRLRNRKA
jgi:ribose transport system permease protein